MIRPEYLYRISWRTSSSPGVFWKYVKCVYLLQQTYKDRLLLTNFVLLIFTAMRPRASDRQLSCFQHTSLLRYYSPLYLPSKKNRAWVKQSEKLIALCERVYMQKQYLVVTVEFLLHPIHLRFLLFQVVKSMSKIAFRVSILPKHQVFCTTDTLRVLSILHCWYVTSVKCFALMIRYKCQVFCTADTLRVSSVLHCWYFTGVKYFALLICCECQVFCTADTLRVSVVLHC
jgi:hypothetical protein